MKLPQSTLDWFVYHAPALGISTRLKSPNGVGVEPYPNGRKDLLHDIDPMTNQPQRVLKLRDEASG